MNLPPRPVAGEPLRASWGVQVIDYLRSITLLSGTGYRVNRTANGTTLGVAARGPAAAPSTAYARLFDLYDVGAHSFKIAAWRGEQLWAVSLSGNWKNPSAGTGMSFVVDSGVDNHDYWTPAASVTATRYVYVSMDKPAGTVSLVMNDHVPNGTEAGVEPHPLWCIPCDEGGNIVSGSIVDLRGAIRLPAIG